MRNDYFLCDARILNSRIKNETIDLIITSPPYWNLKDYANDSQIGFGQRIEDYFKDVRKVLNNCFSVAKPTGTLWLIIDTYRNDKKLIFLPWEIEKIAQEIGWIPRELIIWNKQHNLPFQAKGQMRDVSEFIISLSKTDKYKFHIDRIKTIDEISKWWVDFPERFNPKGKTPTNIWDFPIRTGGTWPSPSMINHHCPFPTGLVYRIIELASDENDVIMDPFAGSGVVLATAHAMNRKYVGFDINPEYKKIFSGVIKKSVEEEVRDIQKKRKQYESVSRDFFYTNVIQLRILKYTRLSTVNFQENSELNSIHFILNITKFPFEFTENEKVKISNYLVVDEITTLLEEELKKSKQRICIAPLSNFQIDSKYLLIKKEKLEKILKINNITKLYLYSYKKTFQFNKEIVNVNEIINSEKQKNRIIPIISNLKNDLAWIKEEA